MITEKSEWQVQITRFSIIKLLWIMLTAPYLCYRKKDGCRVYAFHYTLYLYNFFLHPMRIRAKIHGFDCPAEILDTRHVIVRQGKKCWRVKVAIKDSFCLGTWFATAWALLNYPGQEAPESSCDIFMQLRPEEAKRISIWHDKLVKIDTHYQLVQEKRLSATDLDIQKGLEFLQEGLLEKHREIVEFLERLREDCILKRAVEIMDRHFPGVGDECLPDGPVGCSNPEPKLNLISCDTTLSR